MAVDYVLHLTHSFNHQESFLSNEQRVRGALGEMGVSVLSGCLTTLSATCALFCCSLLWFRNFGIFIALLVIWSLVVALLPMMAAFCYVPGNNYGQIPLPKCLSKAKPPPPDEESKDGGDQ